MRRKLWKLTLPNKYTTNNYFFFILHTLISEQNKQQKQTKTPQHSSKPDVK